MKDTQLFRLIETMDTVEITLNHIEGQNVVYWEDIEQAFPGVKRVRNGNSVIKFLRGSDQQNSRLVLDVVLSTSAEPILANPSKCDPVGLLGMSSSPSSATSAVSKATLFQQIVTHASRNARESEVEQRFISLLAPEVQETVRASSDIYQAFASAIKDGHGELSRAELRQLNGHFQELKDMVAKNSELQEAMFAKQEEVKQLQEQVLNNQEEMKQLQQRALDQLAVLQSRVQAVLTQTYELHEYPIPRLFVVLPQDPSGWDTVNPFSKKFRLYFLCECGEHTKSINSTTKVPHHIHLAKHEGYDITRPSEFFKQYGSYVLTILKMLKFGITVAGVALPALSHLINMASIEQANADLKKLQESIVPGVDQTIGYIDNVMAQSYVVDEETGNQMEDKEALEGADLRKLDTFLQGSDGNKVLGNLYRIVTNEGHVKWVCIDHYRENYNKTAADEFRRAVDSVGGSYDENNGLVKVELRSRVLAEHFYSALAKARSVYELHIVLDMEGNKNDLEALEDALNIAGVSILRLNLENFRQNLSGKLSSTSARYEALVRIVERPNMRLIHIDLPNDLTILSNFSPTRLSHVHKFSVDFKHRQTGEKTFVQLFEALKTNSTVTTLDLYYNSIGPDGAKALAEALKTNSTLATLNLGWSNIGDDGAKALAEVLKANSTLTTLNLYFSSIGPDGAKALAESLKTNSTLTTLNLGRNKIGGDGAKALAEALKTNSTVTTLNLESTSVGSDGAKALAEVLKTNSTLATLNLGRNKIGEDGAKALAEVLKTNSTLATLNLGWSNIGDDGAKALAEVLKTNSTLATLNLGWNNIGDDGVKALAEVLKTNSTLTTLNLYYNSIGPDGAKALAESLKTNSTLTTLNLGRNKIGKDGAKALAEALKTNSTLTTLNLESTSIGSDGAKALAEALKTNSMVTIEDVAIKHKD